MMHTTSLGILLVLPLSLHTSNEGADATNRAELDVEADAGATADADDPALAPATPAASTTARQDRADRRKRDTKGGRWIDRWAPEPNTGELGAYGGIYRPGPRHELFQPDPSQPDQGFQSYTPNGAEIGARVGYYPSRYFGIEAEGGAVPLETSRFDRATLWNARGSLVGQLGRWSLTPFAVVGAGMMGVRSPRSVLGNDIDPALHFGGGLKAYLTRYTQLRLDVRDVVGHQRGVERGFTNHSFEALLGFSVTLGRAKQLEQGGCPIPESDSDGDGFLDSVDQCVQVPGTDDGCPPDTDGDGFLDPDDQCVLVPGVEPAGCPADTDGDGFLDPDDQCVEQPETVNGFEDADGCPDALPEKLAEFNGVMAGIRFQTAKAIILPRSLPRLDHAAQLLREFPDLRVEISGHTDDRGGYDYNVKLSQRRADAVREYLVSQGVDRGRMTTRGAGPNEPIADNRTSNSRARNRRIEFRVITQSANATIETAN